MLRFKLFLVGLAILIVTLSASGQAFGPRYESYLCAAHRNISSGFFSCSEDCQLSHGADGGACLDLARINRYNCICGPPTGRLPARVQQCVEPNDGYRYLCEIDCACNHGAVTGTCHYQTNACLCHGFNPTNQGCPAYSFEHFKMLAQLGFKLKVGRLGPSWLYN